jgi:maltose alpha-D-glucosyltransferase/alpha-amylase
MNWYQKAVIYELYVDKFAGNFQGLISKLDYFNYLGIDTLWILPHYPSPGIDGGYDISDYRSVRPDLGTLADFDQFVNAAHQKGLKVITDMVLNHTSDQHPWFKQSRSSKDNPKRDWYLWSQTPDKFSEAFVHFVQQKGSNWIFNQETGDHYYATFYKQQPDLNWDNPEVKKAMFEVMDFWLDRGVDGFRLDAVSRLIKRDGTGCFALPENHMILKELRSHINSRFPQAILMAETGGWPNEAKTFFGNGDECQLVIHFPLAVKLLAAIPGRDLTGVGEIWKWTGNIPENCCWAVFLTNHDTVDLFFLTDDNQKRLLREKADPDGQFLQENSSSFAARLAEVCRGNPEDIVWATGQQLAQPGVPIIYYGNEIGMRNQSLSRRPADTREYVRGSFDWSEAEKQKSDPDSLLNHVRDAISDRTV